MLILDGPLPVIGDQLRNYYAFYPPYALYAVDRNIGTPYYTHHVAESYFMLVDLVLEAEVLAIQTTTFGSKFLFQSPH